MTKIQRCILEIFDNYGGHLTAEEVLASVKRENPTASMSTVYRNLNIFTDTGKIRRIQRAIGADYYERNLEPHDHAYCVICGKVSDVKISNLAGFLAQNFHHPILSFDLILNYVCLDCAGKP